MARGLWSAPGFSREERAGCAECKPSARWMCAECALDVCRVRAGCVPSACLISAKNL